MLGSTFSLARNRTTQPKRCRSANDCQRDPCLRDFFPDGYPYRPDVPQLVCRKTCRRLSKSTYLCGRLEPIASKSSPVHRISGHNIVFPRFSR